MMSQPETTLNSPGHVLHGVTPRSEVRGYPEYSPEKEADVGAKKLVSIVIPCYNGERFLAEAIESCLRQTYRNLEIILVDDASPDNCVAIAERYAREDSRVLVIRRAQNGGVARAFNTGFNAARGDYFTRLAQDDLFREDAVEAMVRRLESQPDAGLTYCDCQRMQEDGTLLDVRMLPPPSRVLAWRNLVGVCVMWRRAVWQAIGGFDPEYDTAEDYEYWLRVSRSYPLTKCPGGPFFFGRCHEEQGSCRLAAKQEAATVKLIRKHLPANSLAGWRLRCMSLSYLSYSVATDYSISGMHFRALSRLLRSLLLWPLPFPCDERSVLSAGSLPSGEGDAGACGDSRGSGATAPRTGPTHMLRPFMRLKTLIVIVMRMLRLRRR
jgi:glycosyltransferase involved in cell wall biosynthesis